MKPEVNASAASLPSWEKVFHLHDDSSYTGNVYDWMNASGPTNPINPDYDLDGLDGVSIKKNVPPQRVHHWVLYPYLNDDVVIFGDMIAHVWARSRGNESATLVTAIFYDMPPGTYLDTASWHEIGRNTVPLQGDVYSDFKPYNITVPAVNYTLQANHSLVLTICRGDSLNDWLIIMFDQATKDSFVAMMTQNFVCASEAWIQDSTGDPRSTFTDTENAFVWANVSDSFGAYEIVGAIVTLAYAANSTVIATVPMTAAATDPSNPPYWKLYSAELAQLPIGEYSANVTASDSLGSPTWASCSFSVIGVDHFDVQMPACIVSGQAFTMTVKAMNASNELLTDWVGAVQLMPFKTDLVSPGDGTFSVVSITFLIADLGIVNITDQAYTGGEDEVILARASCGSHSGWSNSTTALSGPVDSVTVMPQGSVSLIAGQEQIFTAHGYDVNLNENTTWTPVWTLSSPIGTLVSNGYSATFDAITSGDADLVCSDAGSGANASVSIRIDVGSLSRINITSPVYPLVIREGETIVLAAVGYDLTGNAVPIPDAMWYTTTSGHIDAPAKGNNATYTAGMIPESGIVEVMMGEVVGVLNVSVIEAAHGPTLSQIPSQVYFEDESWVLDLGLYWHDIDLPGDYLTWVVEDVNTTLYFVSHDSGAVEDMMFYTQPNQYGNDTFVLWVWDTYGYRTYRTVTVVIIPVPDPPTFVHHPPTELYVKFDTLYTFDYTYYIEDVDTPKLNLTMSASISGRSTTNILFDHLNGHFTFPTKPGGAYYELVTIAVSDGTGSSTMSVVIWVTDDTPPDLNNSLEDQYVQERCVNVSAWDLDDYFYDIDEEDYLVYYSGFEHVVVWINESTHVVYISAPEEWSGITEGAFTARDPTGALKVATARIVVRPYNNPPEVAHIDDIRVKYNETYVLYLEFYVSDSDDSMDELNVTLNNEHVTHTVVMGVHRLEFLFPPNKNESLSLFEEYSVTVRLTVADENHTDWTDFKVIVTGNSPPRIIVPNPEQLYFAFPEDGYLNNTLRLADIFADDDDDFSSLNYTFLDWTHVRHLVYSGTGVVNLTADPNWFGTEVQTIEASDSSGGWSRVRVYITVQPINDPPALSKIPDMITRGGPRSFSYDVSDYVSDPDNTVDELTFNATWGDMDGSISVVGGILYISLPDDQDVMTVTLIALDGQLMSNSVTFKVGVSKTIAEIIGWPYSFPLVLLAAAVLGYFVASRIPKPHALENIFLIHNDGRLVSHVTKEENTNLDKDVVSAMFTAVQEFVRDSFQKGEVGLKKLEIGDKNVMIEKGESAYLALIYSGWPEKRTFKDLALLLKDIEERYTGRLEHWNGTQKAVAGVERMLQDFMADSFKVGSWQDEDQMADQEWVSMLEKET